SDQRSPCDKITVACSLMIAAYWATRSAAPQACSRIAKPPASPIAYCPWIERQRTRPASPRLDGGSGRVTIVPVGGTTSDRGGFLAIFLQGGKWFCSIFF